MPSIIMNEEGVLQICCLIGGIEAIDPSPVRRMEEWNEWKNSAGKLPTTRSNLAIAAGFFRKPYPQVMTNIAMENDHL